MQTLFISKELILASSLITVWWLPSFTGLYEWIYRTSLGDVVSNMIQIEQNIFEHLNFLISSFGTFTFYTILLLSFIGISYSFFIKKLKLEEIISRYELILISSIPIPFIFYFTSVQTSFRKISLAMVLISIVLLIIGFRNLKPIKNINSVIFICVIILVFSHGKLILEEKNIVF